MRKSVNEQLREDLDKLPFFAWNCITIKLRNWDVDLVIKDEMQMTIFIKFLIYKMRTLDGKKGTAD